MKKVLKSVKILTKKELNAVKGGSTEIIIVETDID